MYRAKHEIHYHDAEKKSAKIVARTVLSDEQVAALGKATLAELLAKGSLIEVNADGVSETPKTSDKKAKAKEAGRTAKTEEEKAADKVKAEDKAKADKTADANKSNANAVDAGSGVTTTGSGNKA